ncbi:MAG: hypothetical protein ISR65_16465 [Bacteriovoracaceae bacterium]|nr:hypothetical protein [Bacteriovoracaceae bacterium]
MYKLARQNIMRLILIATLLMGSMDAWSAPSDEQLLEDSYEDAQIVFWGGAIGAILGLSTLSFVQEPNKHIKSIIVGLSLGIVVGVAIVAWDQANKSKAMYLQKGAFSPQSNPDFPTDQRLSWHNENHASFLTHDTALIPQIAYTFSF